MFWLLDLFNSLLDSLFNSLFNMLFNSRNCTLRTTLIQRINVLFVNNSFTYFLLSRIDIPNDLFALIVNIFHFINTFFCQLFDSKRRWRIHSKWFIIGYRVGVFKQFGGRTVLFDSVLGMFVICWNYRNNTFLIPKINIPIYLILVVLWGNFGALWGNFGALWGYWSIFHNFLNIITFSKYVFEFMINQIVNLLSSRRIPIFDLRGLIKYFIYFCYCVCRRDGDSHNNQKNLKKL